MNRQKDNAASDAPQTTECRPLEGVVVLDMGQIYQGPYCGFMLAMAGATVIKLEPPHGEPIRARRESALPLAMFNGNKLGVSCDLKSPAGRDYFLALVDKADVLIENFSPGTMKRLDLGASTLLSRNPRLVYASASGYGSWGPDADRLAMDLTVQAMSGAMHVTGYPDKPPVKAGPAVADFLGGTHLYAAVTTALYKRAITGLGSIVEVAMQDTMIPAMASNLQLYFENPEGQARVGNRHGALAVAPYNTYRASDGYVAIICVTEEHWRRLCQAMGRPSLADDPKWATQNARCVDIDATDAVVETWTSSRTRAELVDQAQKLRFPCAPVRSLDEVVHDKHLHERGMLQWVDHSSLGRVVLPHSPLRFEGWSTHAAAQRTEDRRTRRRGISPYRCCPITPALILLRTLEHLSYNLSMSVDLSMDTSLIYERQGSVAVITLNRPDKLNAWTPAMEQGLRERMREATDDDKVRVIVLTGAGRAFCAGVDVQAMQELSLQTAPGEDRTPAHDDEGDFQRRYSYLLAVPKPIICGLNGSAAGVGLVLSLYCDMRYASNKTKLAAVFSRRGLVAEHGIAWMLPRMIGLPRAMEWLLSGRTMLAEEAASYRAHRGSA